MDTHFRAYVIMYLYCEVILNLCYKGIHNFSVNTTHLLCILFMKFLFCFSIHLALCVYTRINLSYTENEVLLFVAEGTA